MGVAENRNKNSAMAAHLKAIGYPHGRTMSTRRNEIPDTKEKGSAAYRRLRAKLGLRES